MIDDRRSLLTVVFFLAMSGIAWAGMRVAALTACKTSAACFAATNAGSGAGLQAVSASGDAVFGSSTGSGPGVFGTSKTGTGIEGMSTGGPGAEGVSNGSYGALGVSLGNASAAVVGDTLSGSKGVGVGGYSTTGTAVLARGLQAFVGLGAFASRVASGNALVLVNSKGKTVFTIDAKGNVRLAGSTMSCPSDISYGIAEGVSCLADIPTPKGNVRHRLVRTGRAELRGGIARVALMPTFAASLDVSRPYHVFLSARPRGSQRLFVAQRLPDAFVVRAHGVGGGLQPFEYRIVGSALR